MRAALSKYVKYRLSDLRQYIEFLITEMDFLFLWLVTFVLGFWINKKLRQWKHLPPGPWGFPIVGYLPFFDRKSPHLTLTKLAREYGPIFSIKMGSIPAVVLSDHKLIREAFSKDNFSGRAPLFLTHGIMKGNGKFEILHSQFI